MYLRQESGSQTVAVRTRLLSAAPVSETISCKGRVEETTETAVQTVGDCVVGRVTVQNGERVSKGDVLFTVDKAATLSAMAGVDGATAVKYAMTESIKKEITAPCDGVVDRLAVSGGSLVSGDQICAVIAASEPVQIRLSVPERHIARIKLGQKVKVSGIGFERDDYAGYISEIASSAKQEPSGTGTETTVEAVVTLEEGESDESLRVGLSAKGAVIVSTVPVGYILPYEAVAVDENNREFVYILEGETARKYVFSPKAELTDGYLVTDHFSDDDRLILEPEKIVENGVYSAKEAENA